MDGVIAVAGKPTGFVVTRTAYTHCRLHVEWRWPGKAINGAARNHVSAIQARSGPIGFQLEGTPYQLRNLRIQPLD